MGEKFTIFIIFFTCPFFWHRVSVLILALFASFFVSFPVAFLPQKQTKPCLCVCDNVRTAGKADLYDKEITLLGVAEPRI